MTGVLKQQNSLDIMFGFKSITDFVRSLFGTWYKELVFATSIIFSYIYFGIDVITKYINDNWFSPADMILLTMIIIIFDWATAVYGAVLTKTFETKKAQRLIPMIVANWLMLSGLFHINKILVKPLHNDMLSGSMDFFVLFSTFYLAAVHFVSAIVNAGNAKLIDGKVVQFIMNYVDRKKQEIQDTLK